MPKFTPADISTSLREQWAELVSSRGARETSRESPVMKALQSAIEKLPHEPATTVHEFVKRVIHDTQEWNDAHRRSIESMYESINGTVPTPTQIACLWDADNTDDLAERIADMPQDPPAEDATGNTSGPECEEGECDVDEAWMEEFASEYERDPTVYEYMRLRPSNKPLKEAAGEHRQAFIAMRNVYQQYFDRTLSENEFVKRYIPQALGGNGVDLVESERKRALNTGDYQEAMLTRLTQLYAIISGDDLTDAESRHIFDNEVKEKQLPLDTEELSNIVAEYVNASERMRSTIQDIFMAYLSREAHYDELSEWLPKLRMQPGLQTLLRAELASSHEFHAVLADAIHSLDPSRGRRDQFKVLGEVVRTRSEQLKNVNTSEDIRNIIAACM